MKPADKELIDYVFVRTRNGLVRSKHKSRITKYDERILSFRHLLDLYQRNVQLMEITREYGITHMTLGRVIDKFQNANYINK
jgi:DNA-binding MarR family transcriptional regulator